MSRPIDTNTTVSLSELADLSEHHEDLLDSFKHSQEDEAEIRSMFYFMEQWKKQNPKEAKILLDKSKRR